jgi:hypothetical protein
MARALGPSRAEQAVFERGEKRAIEDRVAGDAEETVEAEAPPHYTVCDGPAELAV